MTDPGLTASRRFNLPPAPRLFWGAATMVTLLCSRPLPPCWGGGLYALRSGPAFDSLPVDEGPAPQRAGQSEVRTPEGPDGPDGRELAGPSEPVPGTDVGSAEFPIFYAQVGEQLVFQFPRLKKYSLSGDCGRVLPPSVLAAKLKKPQSNRKSVGTERHTLTETLLFKATRAGHCALVVWTGSEAPHLRQILVQPLVFEPDSHQRRSPKHGDPSGTDREQPTLPLPNSRPPRSLLLGLSGLTELLVTQTGPQRLLIRGQPLPDSLVALGRLAQAFSGWLSVEVQLPDITLNQWKQELERQIKSSGYSDQVWTEIKEGSLRVHGSLGDQTQLVALKNAFGEMAPFLRWEIETLPEKSQVLRIQAFLLESKEHLGTELGAHKSTPETGIGLQWNPLGADFSQMVIPKIRALEQQGRIHILSEPQIALRCPGEATLFAGGELPIRNHSQYYTQTQWKNFGLQLQIRALATTAAAARLEIQVENSQLDPSLSSTGEPPGLVANRIKSQIDATYSVPLILSGLKMKENHQASEGWSWLRDIPILGLLFGTQQSAETKTSITVVLIPERNALVAAKEQPPLSSFTGPTVTTGRPSSKFQTQKTSELESLHASPTPHMLPSMPIFLSDSLDETDFAEFGKN